MILEGRDGDAVVLTLNQPAKKNALSRVMRSQLTERLEHIECDLSVRAIILTGAGGTFCSGGDITEMQVRSAVEGEERMRLTHAMVRAVAGSRKLTIAAVEGWAAGAGLSLALLCDTIVAAENARFIASFGKVGLLGDLGLLHTLPRRVGLARARQLLFYAEPVNAEDAAEYGLADYLAAPGQALTVAIERARKVSAVAPKSVAMTKEVFGEGFEDLLAVERKLQAQLFMSADHAEGKEAFLMKRPPTFSDH